MRVTLIWKERRNEKKAKTKEAGRTFKGVHVADEVEVMEFANRQAAVLGIKDFTVEHGPDEEVGKNEEIEVIE